MNFGGALGSESGCGSPDVCAVPGTGFCVIHCTPSSPGLPTWSMPWKWSSETSSSLLSSSTTTWSPRFTSIVGPGNCPLTRMARLATPSGLMSPHSKLSLNLRTAGVSSACATAHSGAPGDASLMQLPMPHQKFDVVSAAVPLPSLAGAQKPNWVQHWPCGHLAT